MSSQHFRQMLERRDVRGLRSAWAELFPHLPQPKNDEEAEIVMHRARTETGSLTLTHRAYSHAWLVERGLPSGLPDELKPKAQRIYPVVVRAVGVSVKASSEWLKPVAAEIEKAMANAVEEAYADGRQDDEFVRSRILEARRKATKELLGRWSNV